MTNIKQKQNELEMVKVTIRVLERIIDAQWEAKASIKTLQFLSGAFEAAVERRDSLEQYLRFA